MLTPITTYFVRFILRFLYETMVKVYKLAHLLKHALIFFLNEIIEYVITNEEQAIFWKKILQFKL